MTTGNDFKDFNEQDFINDPLFQDWTLHPNEETDRFWQSFLVAHPEKKEAAEKASALLQAIAFKESWPADEGVERSLTEALATINQNSTKAPVYAMRSSVKSLYKIGWAAAVLVFVVCGLWFLVGRDKAEKPSIALTPQVQDIAPGGNKAVLTLADGTKLILDSANTGAITQQGSATVIKLNDGQLAYQPSSTSTLTSILTYNTITTPRGGQYQLVLADGSKVWLNAASSLRFPTAFAGKERRVELTGEAYFEVAHNEEKPFVVQRGDAEVNVLGTHFNINAYADEPSLKVTLLEGRVKVKVADQSTVLKPGQQAVVQTANYKLQTTNNIDIDEVMAWKNGKFSFGEAANIGTVMRQIARWYNVEIEYRGSVTGRVGGTISRNVTVSQVLDMLEMTGAVKFEITGRKVVVMN